jgi:hypothetical protein
MDTLPNYAPLAVLLLIALGLWRLFGRHPAALPFTKRGSLLTRAEMRFYRTLVLAVPDGLIVCPKVRLMDVLFVDDGAWKEFGAPASGMHVDFVLADAETLGPVLVVELDDRSHSGDAARKRDAFKDAALAAAGVPILRVMAAGKYDAAELSGRFVGAIRDSLA